MGDAVKMGRVFMPAARRDSDPPVGYRNDCDCHWVLASTSPVAYRLEEWCPEHRQVVIERGADPDRPFYQAGPPPPDARLDQ